MRGSEQHHHHPYIISNNHNGNMLKVVGASWVKTRISTMIIAGALLLAIGSIYFIVVDRPAKSGTYCATVYWSTKSGFRTEYWGQQNNLSLVPAGVARACYSDSTLRNGWSQIEIETHPDYPDSRQAYAAGILEGSLTYATIFNHWHNTIDTYCQADIAAKTFCEWMRQTVNDGYIRTVEHADRLSATDHYWHQIRLYFYQLEGLYAGWQTGVERSRTELQLDITDILMLNAAADLLDMRVYYENFVREHQPVIESAQSAHMEYHATPTKASMLIKFTTSRNVSQHNQADSNEASISDDLRPLSALIGHSSDGSYTTMLRTLKRYEFHYHQTENSNRQVAGTSVEFTGYPGTLASSDDFYMISGKRSKLTIGGIRIRNANLDMWRLIDTERSVLMAARVMSANRLAHNGYGWSRVMSGHLGFGTKQWMVLDAAKLHDNSVLLQNTTEPEVHVMESRLVIDGFELVETAPIEAVTAVARNWRKNLLWIVDQLPGRLHAEDVTGRILAGDGFWVGNGVPYFNETLAVSHIEHDESLTQSNMWLAQANMTRLDDVAKVLRSRAYRGDLMDGAANVYGNIDMKLYEETSEAKREFRAIAGPLFYKSSTKRTTTTATAPTTTTQGTPVATTRTELTLLAADDNDEIDPARMSEIDLYSERRLVRDDMRASAMQRNKHEPFRWSSAPADLAVGRPVGHPDEFDFGPVSPRWAWQMQRDKDDGLVN